MTATIVVPIWNITKRTQSIAERCLRNLMRRSAGSRIILVDNASTFPVSLPREMMPEVVSWNQNRGIAPAWNHGAKLAKTEVVVFANSDIFVYPGWLVPLLRLLRDKRLGVAATMRVASEKNYKKAVAAKEVMRVDKVTGACFAMRKSVLKAVGWFDENIVPACFEDTDMWIRLIQKGYYGVASSHSCMQHIGKASCRQAGNMINIWARNRAYIEKKHRVRIKPGSGWMGAERSLGEKQQMQHYYPALGQNV